MDDSGGSQDERYSGAVDEYAPTLERLARAYEADPDQRRDLLQEIHFALWRSLAGFDGRCSLRTWVYRVAHNAAAIGEITGLSARAVATKIHRIEAILGRRFLQEGGRNDG